MRVPEISLGYGLLAQNKHDLCRYYKYTERHKQTQYLPAYTVSFMVVPSVRAWEFRENMTMNVNQIHFYTPTSRKLFLRSDDPTTKKSFSSNHIINQLVFFLLKSFSSG